jgi:internalin A
LSMSGDRASRLKEALRRIDEAKKTHASELDLAGLIDDLKDVGSELEQLKEMRSLSLKGCFGLARLDALAKLFWLEMLNFKGCAKILDLQPLACLASLQSLDLSYCKQIQDLRPLLALGFLQILNLSKCHLGSALGLLRPLLPNLQGLILLGCGTV